MACAGLEKEAGAERGMIRTFVIGSYVSTGLAPYPIRSARILSLGTLASAGTRRPLLRAETLARGSLDKYRCTTAGSSCAAADLINCRASRAGMVANRQS